MLLCPIIHYSSQKVWVEAFRHWGYTRESWTHPASKLSWFTPNSKTKDENLDWPHVLISFPWNCASIFKSHTHHPSSTEPKSITIGLTICKYSSMLNYRGVQMMTPPPPPDYKNCKEHLPTQLTLTPLLHDFQPSIPSVIFLLLHFYWATLQNSTKINCDRMSTFDYKSIR